MARRPIGSKANKETECDERTRTAARIRAESLWHIHQPEKEKNALPMSGDDDNKHNQPARVKIQERIFPERSLVGTEREHCTPRKLE
mmetsp:Transcript_28203/g.79180  ORF Transcript_28203/g.79180 Transcript_28203/m.79180 type:complete len:87 (-) Transcript_28203:389-649(-)